MKKILYILLFVFFASQVSSDQWGNKAWYGMGGDGMCVIGTEANSHNSLSIGYSDGRMALNDYAFSPTMRIAIRNVVGDTFLKTREIIPIKISFDSIIDIDTFARASYAHGDIDMYYLSVNQGRVTDQFDPDSFNYNAITSSMQKHSSMQLKNSIGQTVLDFSLMGFTATFKEFQTCVKKLQ